ncbi:MAG TPA: FGGY family carbohydrate kinase [Steroidobacteraceae bacterium]|nr:FGGY family carbohydrate kinase [Steroidobacteraceae bacterium]
MNTAAPLIAVFDVGKTNARIALVDPALGQEVWSARRANDVVQGSLLRELDVVGIETWLLDALRGAPQRERVAAIVPIAHGAAAVLADHAGNVLIAPDYEDTRFEAVAAEYAALRDPFAVTFSPNLPQGLNLGRQLYYLQNRHEELYRRVSHILMYPQYWSWRLSGVMATEVTALGTHTDLWRPHDDMYSALARKQGWARLMPSLQRATARLGTLRPSVAAATGLPESCVVTCGMHDSNASYLRFLMDREREAFTVVSSGTWTIVMANRGDLRRLREDRDMLANVNIYGAPIATARYMGGREYEAIAQGSDEPGFDALIEVLARGAMALPSFASAGPYSGRRGSIEGAEGLTSAQRAALATLYSALMTAQLIESLGTAGEIFIDGPLARNPLFGSLLGACVPAGTVRIYPEGGGTRVAAHLAGLPSPAPGALRNVAPLRIAGLLEYQAEWRHRLEERA